MCVRVMPHNSAMRSRRYFTSIHCFAAAEMSAPPAINASVTLLSDIVARDDYQFDYYRAADIADCVTPSRG